MFGRRIKWQHGMQEDSAHGRVLLGAALVATGAIWAVKRLGWETTAIEWSAVVWPTVVVLVGMLILMTGRSPAHNINKGDRHE